MARAAGVIAALGLVGPGFARGQDTPQRTGSTGDWLGTLSVPGTELRIVFHIELTEAGTLAGTLDSPDQGAYGLRLSTVEEDSDSVVFAIASLGGRYTGRLSEDGDAIAGEWTQGGGTFPLQLRRTDAGSLAPVRPQEPRPPFPYEAIDVGFENP